MYIFTYAQYFCAHANFVEAQWNHEYDYQLPLITQLNVHLLRGFSSLFCHNFRPITNQVCLHTRPLAYTYIHTYLLVHLSLLASVNVTVMNLRKWWLLITRLSGKWEKRWNKIEKERIAKYVKCHKRTERKVCRSIRRTSRWSSIKACLCMPSRCRRCPKAGTLNCQQRCAWFFQRRDSYH